MVRREGRGRERRREEERGGERRGEEERGGEERGGEGRGEEGRGVLVFLLHAYCVLILFHPHLLTSSHPHTLPDPYHERGLSNLAYFESIKLNSPEQFTDGEETNRTREMTSEHERYQALCREAEPIVSCGEI